MKAQSFIQETIDYASLIKQFSLRDWVLYMAWVGLMLGLFFSTFGFVMIGYLNGVEWPAYVWNVPLGTFIFVLAIAFDTIGHRTIYREELLKGEALVHGVTIFLGISSCIALCLAYEHRDFFRFPALALIILTFFYSGIDEVLHWRRYLSQKSDRVEMWSHVFIFIGHLIMIFSWWYWFEQGYPGVAETLQAIDQIF